MSFAKRLLADEEQVVSDLHPHWKAMVWPFAGAVVVVAAAVYGVVALPSGSARGWERLAIGVVAVALVVWWSVIPYVRWRSTHFVVTNHRIITRTGVISRSGRDIPLNRINDVSFNHGVLDRLLGCGTLVVESGGERGQLTLGEVPHVERVQRLLSELVEEDLRRRPLAPPASDYDPPTTSLR